jgi:uncharacterized membrane protein
MSFDRFGAVAAGNPVCVTTQRDLPARRRPRRGSAGKQIAVSAVAGALLGVPIAVMLRPSLAPILTWDLAAVVYMVWVWRTIWPMDAEQTAEAAVPEDPTRAAADLLTITAALMSLVAVGFLLRDASNSKGLVQALLATLGVLSVAIAWTVVHTVFTLSYARLYYVDSDGGVDFKQEAPPRYSDFAYLSFTIGMTFQVSDTDLTDGAMRRAALRHSLLSYVFGTCVLASAINLVVNL